MKFFNFENGLNTRRGPQLIGEGEGVIYKNIDNSVGHFKPIPDKVNRVEFFDLGEYEILDYGFYFEQASEPYFSETPYDWVVFQEKLYRTDRTGFPEKRAAENVFWKLGI